jgi:hypothetical protein
VAPQTASGPAQIRGHISVWDGRRGEIVCDRGARYEFDARTLTWPLTVRVAVGRRVQASLVDAGPFLRAERVDWISDVLGLRSLLAGGREFTPVDCRAAGARGRSRFSATVDSWNRSYGTATAGDGTRYWLDAAELEPPLALVGLLIGETVEFCGWYYGGNLPVAEQVRRPGDHAAGAHGVARSGGSSSTRRSESEKPETDEICLDMIVLSTEITDAHLRGEDELSIDYTRKYNSMLGQLEQANEGNLRAALDLATRYWTSRTIDVQEARDARERDRCREHVYFIGLVLEVVRKRATELGMTLPADPKPTAPLPQPARRSLLARLRGD